jgi:thioredoxin-dependent peroxiredoxin
MEITYKNKAYTLGTKDRKIEAEAPAVRVKMANNEVKVIGLMAPSVQVMITLNDINKYNSEIHKVINTTKRKVNAYIITSSDEEQIEDIAEKFALEKDFISNDFKNFSLKFGVNIDDSMLANSIFVIDKEGVIKYKEIPSDLEEDFKIEDFSTNLNEVVNFKPTGHTHENWMGV